MKNIQIKSAMNYMHSAPYYNICIGYESLLMYNDEYKSIKKNPKEHLYKIYQRFKHYQNEQGICKSYLVAILFSIHSMTSEKILNA